MILLPPQFHLGQVDTGALLTLTRTTQERETERWNKYDKANKVGGYRKELHLLIDVSGESSSSKCL